MNDVDYDRLLILPPAGRRPTFTPVSVISNPHSFHNEAAWQGRCAVCGRRDEHWHAHHVVYQQHLRARRLPEYDTRGALRLCIRDPTGRAEGDCHFAHHEAQRRVKASELTDDNLAHLIWALGGLDPAAAYLGRYYDAPDPLGVLVERLPDLRAA